MAPLNIGVIGAGGIAQMMHLPHLRDLPELFRVSALCDTSPSVLERVADDYGIAARYTVPHDLLAQPGLDAILVLHGGDHAPTIQAALDAGKHVFTEKPMCFSLKDADRLIETSQRQGVCLMVGYMKWYDPAYLEMQRRLRRASSPQFLHITTIQTPESFYQRHHRIHRAPPDLALRERLMAERTALLAAELPDVPAAMRDIYIDFLLDSAVHDMYVLRGLLGDPPELTEAAFWAAGTSFHLAWRYDDYTRAAYDFVNLLDPGGRYRETVTYADPEQSFWLDFPSPYLRNHPTDLVMEEMQDGAIVRSHWVGSYEEAFKQELLHFRACIDTGMTPRSSGIEGRTDMALLQDAIRLGSRHLKE